MESQQELSKTERRRLAKAAKKAKLKAAKEADMSDRQKLRVQTKEKKILPKLSREDRKRKYQSELIEKPREQEAAKKLFCLHCKRKGHALKDCPEATAPNASTQAITDKICYNCGRSDHALRTCKQPRQPDGHLPYATCFICKGTGHISKDCKENPNGLYPKGGGCLICSSKFHFARDCPEKKSSGNKYSNENENSDDNRNDNMNRKKAKRSKDSMPNEEVNNRGGDDDDFDFDVNLPSDYTAGKGGDEAVEIIPGAAERKLSSHSHKKKKSKR